MRAEFAITSESQRQARDAETAHLDAVLKVNGAKALRLAHVLELLRQSGQADVELKVSVGEEPHIWLDLMHRITMEPDAKTYRLSALSQHRIDVLLETENLDLALIEAQKVLAHKAVKQVWGAGESGQKAKVWNVATLFYVWLTGVVAGAAGLALISIYLKKITF